ncbi:MAG: hypothetical protein HQK89_02645 [Nitrospirae bacterium]|nr:hypothetical protein [Nitrospirota bacterium]
MGNILADCILIIKRNVIIVTPAIIVSLITVIISIILIGNNVLFNMPNDTAAEVALIKEVIGRLFVVTVINFYLQVFAHAVTVVIAFGAINGARITVQDAFSYTVGRGWRLLIAATLFGTMIFFGFFLFVIPAVVFTFLFMFTFIIIIKEDKGPIESLRKSYAIARMNLSGAFHTFLMIAMSAILFTLLTLGITENPYVNIVVSSLLSGLLMSFGTLLLMRHYLIINKPEVKTN